VLAALVAVVADILSITIAIDRHDALSTTMAVIAIGASILAVILGLIAVFTGRGRVSGVAGILIGIVANPLVLIAVLEFFARV
jgi:hypothetical protein